MPISDDDEVWATKAAPILEPVRNIKATDEERIPCRSDLMFRASALCRLVMAHTFSENSIVLSQCVTLHDTYYYYSSRSTLARE